MVDTGNAIQHQTLTESSLIPSLQFNPFRIRLNEKMSNTHVLRDLCCVPQLLPLANNSLCDLYNKSTRLSGKQLAVVVDKIHS